MSVPLSGKSSIVQQRLDDVVNMHESSLSRAFALSNSSMHVHKHDDDDDKQEEKEHANVKEKTKTKTNEADHLVETSLSTPITEAAQLRSYTSQPPFQYNDVHSIVADIQLNPSERAAPQDLLENCHLHVNNETYNRDLNTEDENCFQHQRQCLQHDVHKMTIKTITVLSVLTEECDEIHKITYSKYLPQLSLFGNDLSAHNPSSGGLSGRGDNVDELDEEIMHRRDGELLKRIGKFISVLQTVYNLVYRCQKLVKNLVYQLYGCRSRFYMYQEDEYYELESCENGDDSVPLSSGVDDIDGVSRLGMEIEAELHMNPEPPLFRSVNNVIPVGQAICKLLEILISIDTVMANNSELLEGWDLYKSVVMERERDSANGVSIHIQEDEDTNVTSNHNHIKPVEVVNIGVENPTDTDLDDATDSTPRQGPCKQQLLRLDRMLVQLDFTLLSSRSFLVAIEQNFDPENDIYEHHAVDQDKDEKEKSDTLLLHEEVKNLVLLLSKKYCAVIDTEGERNERTAMVGVYGLYCLYRRLLPSNVAPDEKVHHMLCTILPRTSPILPLYGELPFFPAEFLSRYSPLEHIKSLSIKLSDTQAVARRQLSKRDSRFTSEVSTLYREVLLWMLSAESTLARSENMSEREDNPDIDLEDSLVSPVAAIEKKVKFILKGVSLGRRVVSMLRNYLLMHKNLMEPVPSSHLTAIEKLCGAAKSIESMLRGRKRSCVVLLHKAGLKLIAAKMFKILAHLRSFVDCHHSTQQAQMSRIEASLSVLESILKGGQPFSSTRLHAIKVAIYSCYEEQEGGPAIDLDRLQEIYEELDTFSNIDDVINDGCDCSFLFFHTALCAPLIRHIYRSTDHSDLARMQSIFSAFSDASHGLLRASTYLERIYSTSIQLDKFRHFFLGEVVQREIICPVVADIENTLRHRIHAKNIPEMSSLNPHNHSIGVFTKFVEAPPLHFCGTAFSMKAAIENNLVASLYNSSTVGLRDTNSHTEMAVLANSYGLTIVDSILPARAADQGVDLIHINKKFEEFISSYNYNMNQQVFMERSTMKGGRYINTVGIETVSASLSRHGFGIISATVDRAHHFISKTLKNFLCTISNEIMISSMSKEMRWFEDQQQNEKCAYPYERALAFWHDLSSVHSTENDLSLLDESKILITRIGNALGLLRLLRSGEMYFVRHSRKYQAAIPTECGDSLKSKNISKLQPLFEAIQHREPKPEGIHIFPHAFQSFREMLSISENIEYLGALYILYPALSLSWLDSTLRGKGMLRKKIKTSEGFFSDDGFALGNAFLFQALGLTKKIDGLNWPQSFRKQFAHDKLGILERSLRKEGTQELNGEIDNVDDNNEVTRLQLAAKQLELKRQEMELLQFSLHAAVIMFDDAAE